jgi:hypothetical protein
LKPPCLIVVGSVVSLYEQLSWFEPEAAAEDATTAQVRYALSVR